MTSDKQPSLSERLRQIAEDPMWPNHVEVRKRTITEVADELDLLSRELAASQETNEKWAKVCEDLRALYTRASDAREALRAELRALKAQEPVAWLRFWAAQRVFPDGNVDAEDGYEVCQPYHVGADGSPAFPVFASPVPPAPAAQVSSPEAQVDAAIQAVWEQDEANCADAPRTPHDAFRAGALWALNSRFGPVAGGSDDGDLVLVERGLIGAACAAITRRTDAPKTLAALREITVGAVSPAQKDPGLTNSDLVKLWGPRSDGPDNHEIISYGRAILAAAQKEASKP